MRVVNASLVISLTICVEARLKQMHTGAKFSFQLSDENKPAYDTAFPLQNFLINLKDSHQLPTRSDAKWGPGHNCSPALDANYMISPSSQWVVVSFSFDLIGFHVHKEFGFYVTQARGFFL